MIGRIAVSLAVVACAACTVTEDPEGLTVDPASSAPSRSSTGEPTASPSQPGQPSRPQRFRADRAMRDVRALAGRIGPREATSAAFRQGADLVHTRLAELGYSVSRQRFRVPAGSSWDVPVGAGWTSNVVGEPPGFTSSEPYLILGAHLDTVPQAPGAEDNASGVSVLMELARVASSEPTRVPVVFVAFGAEEPRGSGDDWHHFGSRAYTAAMSRLARRNLVAMVSLDRVGVGLEVPVCGGGLTDGPVVADLRSAARRARVPTTSCGVNQSSDHWSFERAGLPAARLGSTAYSAYHSAQDVPSVVQEGQLRRVGELAWAYIAAQ